MTNRVFLPFTFAHLVGCENFGGFYVPLRTVWGTGIWSLCSFSFLRVYLYCLLLTAGSRYSITLLARQQPQDLCRLLSMWLPGPARTLAYCRCALPQLGSIHCICFSHRFCSHSLTPMIFFNYLCFFKRFLKLSFGLGGARRLLLRFLI